MKPILVLIFSLCMTFNAHAALFFNIEVTSNTTAVITGSGTLDVAPTDSRIGLDNVFNALSPFNPQLSSNSTMTMGGDSMWSYFYGIQDGSGFGVDLYTHTLSGTNIGDVLTGFADLDISGTAYTFNSIGSTGQIISGSSGTGAVLGAWEITSAAVPEPSILALFALGLAGVGFTCKRKSQA